MTEAVDERVGEQQGVADVERSGLGSTPDSGSEPGAAGSRLSRSGIALGALWLLAAVLGVRQAAAVLRLPPGERLTDLETWLGENGVLHVKGSLYDGDGAFTGTPFAGLALKPLTRAAEQSLGVAWTFGTLLLVVALGLVVARTLPSPVSRNTKLLAAPVALCLMALSLPVRNTFTLGQTSIIPVLLILLTLLPRTSQRQAGVLTGLAAALQPALLLFTVVQWLTGRRRATAFAGGTFALCTVLAWAVMPRDSQTYWLHHIGGAGLGGSADGLANQSLHGLLLRIGLSGPVELSLLAVLAVAVAVVGLRRAVYYAKDGQLLLAAAITGCVALAVSPTSWQYQQLWILLAVVGRVGKRSSDRLVWPVLVVLVMTLNRTALMPDIDFLGHIAYNAPLLAALAAALVVPFLTRTSPLWDKPVQTPYADRAESRFRHVPLLRFYRRPLTRPNLMLELMLIRIGYFGYSYVRAHAPDERSLAEGHGRQILDLEGWLHIDCEHWFNHIVADTPWLKDSMGFYYSSLHFFVPITLLAWLYVTRPAAYRWARTPLAFATLLALIGFWLYPLAPPRLMPGLGYVDTAHGPQDLENPDFGALTKLSNQYAAMPSLHVGWSLWCGVIIALVAPKMWIKILGLMYPVLTTAVIVGTANHYVLDAVGGAVVVAAGFALQYALTGAGKVPPPEVAATGGGAAASLERLRTRLAARAGREATAEAGEPTSAKPAVAGKPTAAAGAAENGGELGGEEERSASATADVAR
ncbi:bifunctional glycosyltransferase 87/phosphatase PAP2 family protein [Streptomyces sp. XD-27]|uniref:bifunctional glycosyltransferase 87/phosphatase PAP2 family protein n=1 Tax=Streptomyces sp. XD-27 TaxID=3062779 RepID=UPI0026F460A1|nr:bifunctional glycosyltransferase 87/phosphatase PAP2 family protein [Streptomyces sp. XD-27]WKX70101.1 bifunctional glycosyltransferase 87/phosphatase PAP2 family protein [Streptomyces sp. XD-27]